MIFRFGSWRDGTSFYWNSKENTSLSLEDRQLIRRKQEEFRVKQLTAQANARLQAQNAWNNANTKTKNHPYLSRKGVKSYGLRLYNNCLLIPLHNENKEVESLQFINSNGEKWFKKDAITKGCFFIIGSIENKIYICEGYATAASIHEATNTPTVVAFNANNLIHVTKIFRNKYPNAEIIICADNDAYSSEVDNA